jgi:hypothetical protein
MEMKTMMPYQYFSGNKPMATKMCGVRIKNKVNIELRRKPPW